MTSFRVLGPVEAWTDERRLALGGPQPAKLLACLLLNANRAVSADAVIDALWGAERERAAKHRLQMGVLRLRRALEPLDHQDGPRLRTVSGGYLLSVRSGELDAEVFAERVRDGRRALEDGDAAGASELLAEALELWRGPPLAEVAYEDFAQSEIRRLEELRLMALESRIDAELQLGRHAELIGELEGLLAEQPTRERIAGQLMTALYRSERQAEALEVYQRTRARLVDDLGLEPGPALKAIQAQVLQQAGSLHPGGSSIRGAKPPSEEDGARAREGDVPPPAARLPIPPTPILGRRQQIEAVGRLLLSPEVGLLTLVGPGGVGKTRLALAVAHECESQFPDGAWWVELGGVERADDVPSAAARALALVPRDGESARDALVLFLAQSRALLVIDNFEHLLEGAGLLADLLATCPGLTVLVTSREALSLTAEHCVVVEPLPFPADPSRATVSEVEAAEATALFLAAARRRDVRFAVTSASAPVIASVCARLDGLPLALELAAAPAGLLGINELAARLDSAFASLGVSRRDVPGRHQTLRATIEWSYRLLEPGQRSAFVRFAVFAGGATLDAASTVTNATVETLLALVGKSLIDARHDADGSSRLVMLETVRQFGLQRLADDPDEEDSVRRRHGEYYLHVLEQAALPPATDRTEAPLSVLENDIDNVRVAVRWAREEAPAWSPRLVDTLKEAWWIVGGQADAKDLVETALRELDPLTQPDGYAELLDELSRIQWTLGSGRESLESAERALAMLPGDRPGRERTRLLSWLARIQLLRGRYSDAARDAREAITAAGDAGDRRSEGAAWNTLGTAEIALGRVDEGAGRLRRAIELSREQGDLKRTEGAYANLAEALTLAGRTREGLEVAREGLVVIPERSTPDHGWLMLEVSDLSYEAGDWQAARSNLHGSPLGEVGVRLILRRLCEVQLALGVGDLNEAADCLEEIGPLIESSVEPQWVGRHGALLAELLTRQGHRFNACTVVGRTLAWLKDRTEDVMRISQVAAVGASVEADTARDARDRGDATSERDAISRCELHLRTLRDAAHRGSPVELARRAVGTAELTRACGRSDPSTWLNAAQQWDAIARPYPSAVARWRAANALLEHGNRAEAAEVARSALRTARTLGSRWLIEEITSVADLSGLEPTQGSVPKAVG